MAGHAHHSPVSSDEVHDQAARRLAASHQRYTGGRRALVEVLAGASRPMTLPEILDADRSLAQSSAYRNLAELIEAQVVHRIITSDEHGRFELSEDLTEHHHHLICTTCGAVADFTVPARLERELDRTLDGVASREGFVADHHRLDLVGRCAGCA
jgi:Fe2+ or Zn2+ uptake regulation protein